MQNREPGTKSQRTNDTACLALSKVYLEALRGWEAILPQARVTVTDEPIGTKQGHLRAWLEQQPWQPAAPHERALADTPRGSVVIGGVQLHLTPEAVLEQARAALAANPQGADRYRDWYVPLDEQRIAPKWLVSQLSGLPVTAFGAAAARRVLHGLGIAVKRVAGSILRFWDVKPKALRAWQCRADRRQPVPTSRQSWIAQCRGESHSPTWIFSAAAIWHSCRPRSGW